MKSQALRVAAHAVCVVALVLGMGLFGVATATAGILTVSTGGTFAAGTPTSTWTGAGDTWTLSFLVNSTPTISSYVTGTDFDLPFTSFVYTLNGSVVSVGAVDVEAYNISDAGLFNICFFGCTAASSVTNGFVITGPQAYSGSESAPTIVTGSYAEAGNTVYVSSVSTVQADGTINIAPEPSTAGLSVAGLLIVAAVTFLRKRPVASTPSARR